MAGLCFFLERYDYAAYEHAAVLGGVDAIKVIDRTDCGFVAPVETQMKAIEVFANNLYPDLYGDVVVLADAEEAPDGFDLWHWKHPRECWYVLPPAKGWSSCPWAPPLGVRVKIPGPGLAVPRDHLATLVMLHRFSNRWE